MILWSPVEMREGERIDRAIADDELTPDELFIRRRTPGAERFRVDHVDLPAQANEAAALAQWRARPAHPQTPGGRGRGRNN